MCGGVYSCLEGSRFASQLSRARLTLNTFTVNRANFENDRREFGAISTATNGHFWYWIRWIGNYTTVVRNYISMNHSNTGGWYSSWLHLQVWVQLQCTVSASSLLVFPTSHRCRRRHPHLWATVEWCDRKCLLRNSVQNLCFVQKVLTFHVSKRR